MNQRLQTPHRREHSAVGGVKAATVPAVCVCVSVPACVRACVRVKCLQTQHPEISGRFTRLLTLLPPSLEVRPPNPESAFAAEQVTPVSACLQIYPWVLEGAHSKSWVSHGSAKAMRESLQGELCPVDLTTQ